MAFVKAAVAGLLLAVVAAIVWFVIAYGDSYAARASLCADAADLKATEVSAHAEIPIEAGKNVVWCGTFQLAWNEMCALVGEDFHLRGNEPEMVPVLNQKSFSKDDIDDASYVALADVARNNPCARITGELQSKFGGRANPQLVPSPEDTPHPDDIVAYSYLFKTLQFDVDFERIDRPLTFAGRQVSCFGIDEEFKPAQGKMCSQVLILDYRNSDNFTVELITKSHGDRLVLAKIPSEKTLRATIAAVHDRMAAAKPNLAAGAVLKIPRINFDITRRYTELIGAYLALKNPLVAKDSRITSAMQEVRFRMDEHGVVLESESHLTAVKAAVQTNERKMIFDKPFLVMLERQGAKMPYFAMWVENPELLERANRELGGVKDR
jgi:hypothetical protein